MNYVEIIGAILLVIIIWELDSLRTDINRNKEIKESLESINIKIQDIVTKLK